MTSRFCSERIRVGANCCFDSDRLPVHSVRISHICIRIHLLVVGFREREQSERNVSDLSETKA